MEDRPPVPITAPPAKDQSITHEGKTYTTVQEGKAYILTPPNARTSVNPHAKAKADEEQKVFYNPIQQFNRDLSVLAIKAYGEELVRRKTAAREVRKKKEEGKKERKKQKKAEQTTSAIGKNGPDLVDEGADAMHEATKVVQAESSKKRKRTDEDEDEEGQGQLRKAQKGGDMSGSHNEDATSQTSRVTDEAAYTTHSEFASAALTASTILNGLHAIDGEKGEEQQNGQKDTTRPFDSGFKPWQPPFRILDALSATGLRALRYATEIPTATAVVANDRDGGATAAIALNVQHNDLSSKISTSTGDATGHMYAAAFPPPTSHGPAHISSKYDVIDLDPYGTAAPFIDAALQALNDEGMLCVTCTDSGVFASCGYSEKTFSLYGGMPIKGSHAHEGGLRLVLHSIASSAAKYSLAIEPLLSLSIDFYARIFIRVRKSPADVKFLAGKTMLVYECDVGCGAWTTQFLGRHQRHGKGESSWKFHISMAPSIDKVCEHCGSKMHVAGPMWGGPLHNAAFVEKMLDDAEGADKEVYQTLPRIEGMLDTALSELLVVPDTLSSPEKPSNKDTAPPEQGNGPIIPPTPPHIVDHHPFYFIPSALCKVIKAVAPPEAAVRGALRKLGYVATRSHAKAGSLKTDAPFSVIWEVMREWVRQKSPVKMENLREGGPGWNILSKMRKSTVESNGKEGQDNPASATAGAGANGDSATDGDTAMPDQNADTPDITVAGASAAAADQPAARPPQPEPGKELDVSKLEIVFDEKLGRDQDTGRQGKGTNGRKRLVRYQQNPRENWGPMARAKGHA